MTNLSYQGNSITQRDIDGYVNATEMAKANQARLDHWLENKQAKEYLKALQESISPESRENDRLIVVEGFGAIKTTWVHPLLAIAFAQWISPAFHVWCNQHIKTLMETGQTSVNATQPTLSVNDIKKFAGIAGQLNKLPDSELKSTLQSQLMANLTKSQVPKQTDDEILLEKILAKTPPMGVTASELRRNIRAFRDTPTSEINDLIQILVKSGRGYTELRNKALRFFRGQKPNNITLD
jgi:hypothetical protein